MPGKPGRVAAALFVLLLIAGAVLVWIPSLRAAPASSGAGEPRHYDIGSPMLTDIWVDPARGSDSATGNSRSQALSTIVEAWNRIPSGTTLTGTGYRILLAAGDYPESSIPTYLESRHGTHNFPLIIQGADGREAATLKSELNIYDCTYMYLIDFNIIADPGGECLHNEQCRNFLVRDMRMNGGHRAAQETVKVNQCQYYYIEDSDISSAWNVAVDFMAVQHGHVVGNRVHDAGDWCMYFKGGSCYITAEGNELFDADNGGFAAGDGTGFDFMVSPWIHYETYDIKFVNNIVHDTQGAGIGVIGSYNTLVAYNTLYRVGSSSHGIEVIHGTRSCDGNAARCSALLAQGGWGTATHGTEYEQPIPARNVYIYDNVLYNPPGFQSAWSHLSVEGPRTPATGSNIPAPSRVDTNLRIRGNMIWNGPAGLPLGIGEPDQGGQASNPTCNPAQVRADNSINEARPQLVDPEAGDFAPRHAGTIFTAATYAPPVFPGGDRPSPPLSPEGDLDNSVTRDFYGNPRSSSGPPGAIAASPTSTFYFAEGYTGSGFSEYLCIGNPGSSEAHVAITYLSPGGGQQRQDIAVPASSRSTVSVNDAVGPGREVSAKVTSDRTVAVERPMYFDYGGITGGHVTRGASRASSSWYFAEGYTGDGFDDYICVLNPGSHAASLSFHFQTEERGEVVKDGLSVGAGTRATFKMNDLLGGGYQCSLALSSNRPVVAERPMYFRYNGRAGRGWDGGHCVVGASGLGTTYLFAEGTTRPGFDEWLTLQNPGSSAIEVSAVYQFAPGQGASKEKTYTVEPGHRRTVFVAEEVGTGKDVSVRLSAPSAFLAERPMYFSYGNEGWDGGHCVVGARSEATDWFFAEGYTGPGFDEWLCLWNPGGISIDVEVLYFTQEAGALAPRTVRVPAGSRVTLKVNDHAGPGYQLSVRLHAGSGAGFVVERPMYFNYKGITGGHDA
ncbi:MAG TPA: right-handed parallel beta-helix repeat-containing protein [Candidatus Anoxymicrobiaceae bacterium]